MENGERFKQIEEKLDKFESRWDKNKEARDAESSEIREAIATLDARQGEGERISDRISAQLSTLLERKQPGMLEFWGPTVATAVALAALFIFILRQSLEPFHGSIQRVDEKIDDTVIHMNIVFDKQWSMYGEQRYMEGRVDALGERLNDMDKLGPRSKK